MEGWNPDHWTTRASDWLKDSPRRTLTARAYRPSRAGWRGWVTSRPSHFSRRERVSSYWMCLNTTDLFMFLCKTGYGGLESLSLTRKRDASGAAYETKRSGIRGDETILHRCWDYSCDYITSIFILRVCTTSPRKVTLDHPDTRF